MSAHTPLQRTTTRTGVVIGRAYVPSPPAGSLAIEAERVQSALLTPPRPRLHRLDKTLDVLLAFVIALLLAMALVHFLSPCSHGGSYC